MSIILVNIEFLVLWSLLQQGAFLTVERSILSYLTFHNLLLESDIQCTGRMMKAAAAGSRQVRLTAVFSTGPPTPTRIPQGSVLQTVRFVLSCMATDVFPQTIEITDGTDLRQPNVGQKINIIMY